MRSFLTISGISVLLPTNSVNSLHRLHSYIVLVLFSLSYFVQCCCYLATAVANCYICCPVSKVKVIDIQISFYTLRINDDLIVKSVNYCRHNEMPTTRAKWRMKCKFYPTYVPV